MGFLSTIFGRRGNDKKLSPGGDDKKLTRTRQRRATESNVPSAPIGLPCRPDGTMGTIPSVYVTSANDLAAMQYDRVSGQVIAVKKEDVARAQTYDHARLLESFERWGQAPVEVQQEVERAVRESEKKYGANAK